MRSRFANKCLDIEGGNARPGQPVIVWSCAGGPNQRWN
ncbi:ricin-type beta-trefoil lectin domain protein [Delftia acidovorans]